MWQRYASGGGRVPSRTSPLVWPVWRLRPLPAGLPRQRGAFKSEAALSTVHVGQMLRNLSTCARLCLGSARPHRTGCGTTGECPPVFARCTSWVRCACWPASWSRLWSLFAGARAGRRRQPARAGPETWRLDDLLVLAVRLFGRALRHLRATRSERRAIPRRVHLFASILAGRLVARGWSKLPAGKPGPCRLGLGCGRGA